MARRSLLRHDYGESKTRTSFSETFRRGFLTRSLALQLAVFAPFSPLYMIRYNRRRRPPSHHCIRSGITAVVAENISATRSVTLRAVAAFHKHRAVPGGRSFYLDANGRNNPFFTVTPPD